MTPQEKAQLRGRCSGLGGSRLLLCLRMQRYPNNRELVLGLGSSCLLLKRTIKRLFQEVLFSLPSRTTVCLGPGGKTFPLLPSPWQEIYSERMLIILFSTYFLYIILIPLFLIILPICFGSQGLQMEQTKASTVLELYLQT